MTPEDPSDPFTREPGVVGGRPFLLGGTALLLFVALLAFLWVIRSDTTEADRTFWGTPTPTPEHKVLPF